MAAASVPVNPPLAQHIARVLPAPTPSHRQIADWVLAHPPHAATMPIDELAATVGVSVATANRFARALEFDGYAQFRAALVLGFETTLAPVEKLRSKLERSATAAEVFSGVLADIQHDIGATRQALDPQACERTVDAILKARRVYALGLGASNWLAGLLRRGNLLIPICFPRYLADTVLLTRRSRETGAPVLALTDRVSSPVARLAEAVLPWLHGADGRAGTQRAARAGRDKRAAPKRAANRISRTSAR